MDSELLNLLLLPLLGGYVFISRLHWTSLAAKKIEGQRLVYSCSVIGVFLILLVRAAEIAIEALQRQPPLNALLVSTSLGLTLIAQAMVGTILGGAAVAGQLDRSRDSAYLPRAASACGVLLIVLLFPMYPLLFEVTLWHLPAAVVVGIAMLLLVRFVANWVRRTSNQSTATAVIRVALLFLAVDCGAALVLSYGASISDWWSSEFSSIRYSGIALAAAALGAIGWMPVNVILTDRWAWRRAHENGQTSGLELLLYTAWIKKSAMQLTLKDGKVYVGYIAEMPAPKPTLDGSCIEFIPMSSGYRKADRTVQITTDYAGVLAKLRAEAEQHEKDAKATLESALALLSKVVPISEVSVAALYSDQYMAEDLTIRSRQKKSAGRPKPRSKPTTPAAPETP